MYLGTKINFRSSMIPQQFENEDFQQFNDYTKAERKVITVKSDDVLCKTSAKTLKSILFYIKKEHENIKTDAYGVIKLIETNTTGNNTLKYVEPSLLITFYLYSKPKKKKVLKEKTN